MRLIDADARIDDLMERYCKECDKRKGIKNGKRQFIYEIGEAPCRACEVDDVKAELEEAPTIEAIPIEWMLKWERNYRNVMYAPFKTLVGVMIDDWLTLQKGEDHGRKNSGC